MASSAGLKVGIQGEAEFKRGIKDINGEMRNLRSELYATDKEFGKSDKSVEALTSRNKIYTKQVDEQRSKVTLLTNQHSKQKDELVKLEKTLEETNKAHGEGSKEVEKAKKAYDDQEKSVRKLESQLGVATSQLNGFEKQMKDNSKELALQSSEWTKLSDKIGETGTKIKTTSETMQSIGSSMTKGITVPLMGIGAIATKVGSDFESGMSEVAAISGATGNDLKGLEDIAKEMGAATKFSASEAAEGLKYMAMAGWDAHQMTAALPGVLDLAAASGEDLGMTSDIVTDSLTGFGLQAEDASSFADLLASASSNSNTNVAMMGETFKYVAPLFGSLGYSAEDAALATGLLANAGIKGSQAGTTLRSSITNLIKPTAEGATAIEELGITMTDATGEMKPFDEVMGDLRGSFKDLNEEQQAQYAATIFGKEAMSGMLAIINASEGDYNKLTTATTNYTGAASRMADIMEDNLQGQITKLKSGLEGLGIQIFEEMVPYLTSFTKSIQDVVKSFSRMSPEMRKTIVTTGALVAGIGPLIFMTGKLGGVLTSGVKFIGTFTGAIGVMTTGAVAATPAIGGMATALTFLTGPVGIAVVGIAALSAGLGALYIKQKNYTTRTEEQIEATNKFIDSSDALNNKIASNVEAREQSVITTESEIVATQNLADRIFELSEKENLSAVEKNLLNVLVGEFNQLMPEANLLIDEATGLLIGEKNVTQELIDKQTERIRLAALNDMMVQNKKDEYEATQLLAQAQGEVNRVEQEWADKQQKAFDDAKNKIDYSQRISKLQEEYAPIVDEAREAEDELRESQRKIVEEGAKYEEFLKNPEAYDEYKKNTETVTVVTDTAVKNYSDAIGRWEEEDANSRIVRKKGWADMAVDAFTGAEQVTTLTKQGFDAGRKEVSGSTRLIKEEAMAELKPMEGEALTIGQNTGNNISTAISNSAPVSGKSSNAVYSAIKTAVDPLTGEMTTIGSTLGANLATELDKKKAEARSAGVQLYMESHRAVMPIVAMLGSYGANAGIGFHDGMRDQKKSIASQSDGIVQKVLSIFKTGFGISSPGTVTYGIGHYAMEGFLNALQHDAVGITKFIDKMLGDILGAFEDGNFNLTAAIDFVGTGAMEFFKSIGIGGSDFGSLVIPVDGAITSGFGYRSAESTSGVGSTNHMGVDIGAGHGVEVGAAGAGTVSGAGWWGGYGNAVEIDHGGGLKTFYAHLSKILVGVGQVVKQLQTIGLIGSTGNSTGAHLHFGVMQDGAWVDPSPIWGYDVGTRYVPKTQIAMVHQGEMIVPKSENPYANSGGQIMPGNGAKQPLKIQVMLQDGRVLAETIVDDINNLLGGRKILQDRGMA